VYAAAKRQSGQARNDNAALRTAVILSCLQRIVDCTVRRASANGPDLSLF